MSGKDRVEISKRSKKAETSDHLAVIVSEGSMVVLDARDFLRDIDANSVRNYSWKPKDVHLNPNQSGQDKSILSFRAPYVKRNDLNTTLKFELSITDKEGKTRNPPYEVDVIIKRVQRAIIFQGGVALGAYEAGVYRAIVEKLSDQDGTSIGAMNGAIVVSSVTDEHRSVEGPKNWEDSAKNVMQFWRAQEQFPTVADIFDSMNPFYHYGWDAMHNTSKIFKESTNELMNLYSNMDPILKSFSGIMSSFFLVEPSTLKDSIIDGWYIPATAEAARRYYSAQQFLHTWGAFNVATGIPLWGRAFGKFFDFPWQFPNFVPRPDNKHFVLFSLKRTLERFARFPIEASHGDQKIYDILDYHFRDNPSSKDIFYSTLHKKFKEKGVYGEFFVDLLKNRINSNTPTWNMIDLFDSLIFTDAESISNPELYHDLWTETLNELPDAIKTLLFHDLKLEIERKMFEYVRDVKRYERLRYDLREKYDILAMEVTCVKCHTIRYIEISILNYLGISDSTGYDKSSGICPQCQNHNSTIMPRL